MEHVENSVQTCARKYYTTPPKDVNDFYIFYVEEGPWWVGRGDDVVGEEGEDNEKDGQCVWGGGVGR